MRRGFHGRAGASIRKRNRLIRLHRGVIGPPRTQQRGCKRDGNGRIVRAQRRDGREGLDAFVDAPRAHQQRTNLVLHAHEVLVLH